MATIVLVNGWYSCCNNQYTNGQGIHGSRYETKKALYFMPQVKYVLAMGVRLGAGSDTIKRQVVVSRIIVIWKWPLVDGLVDHWYQCLANDNQFHELIKNPQNFLRLSEIPALQPWS